MKQLRNLSGVYFREKIDGKWENVCFEELSEERQEEVLSGLEPEAVQNLAKHLAETICEIGDQLDLSR